MHILYNRNKVIRILEKNWGYFIRTFNSFIFVIMANAIHHGKNIERFRKMFGLKQETLAARLGSDWNQKKISYLEAKAVIEDDIIKDVAEALHITPDAIKNFSEEIAFAFISSTFNDSTIANYISHNNPVYSSDKAIELLEKALKEKDAIIRELLSKIPNQK